MRYDCFYAAIPLRLVNARHSASTKNISPNTKDPLGTNVLLTKLNYFAGAESGLTPVAGSI
jgi:hypothetical protein